MDSSFSTSSPQTVFFHSFSDVSSYLDKLGLFRMKPGLGRIREMLLRLDLKRPPFTAVQVAGTNGKGSTCAMLESLARSHGLATGLHSSPHLVSVRERIRVNGRMLEEDRWTTLANDLMRAGGEELSYFEFVTCLAVLAFARADVDIAIMETGLGGLFDATSALDVDMLVFTPFDLDHQAILGPTLKDIAADKAGCIRPGKPVVSALQKSDALSEIRKSARAKNAPLEIITPGDPLPADIADGSLPVLLQGGYQTDNMRLALAAWRRLARDGLFSPRQVEHIRAARASGPDAEALALAKAWLPARMQNVPPLPPGKGKTPFPCSLGWPRMLLDSAHNPHGMAALGFALARMGIAPAAVIFACVADKDINLMLPHLRTLATGPIFVPPIKDNPRSLPPETLAARIGLNAAPAASMEDALAKACAHLAAYYPEVFRDAPCKSPLLVCGSLYLLGEFFSLRPDCLEPPPYAASAGSRALFS